MPWQEWAEDVVRTATAMRKRRKLQAVMDQEEAQKQPSISAPTPLSLSTLSAASSSPPSSSSVSSSNLSLPPNAMRWDLLPNDGSNRSASVPNAVFGLTHPAPKHHALVMLPSPTASMEMVCVTVYFALGVIALARSCRFQYATRNGGVAWSDAASTVAVGGGSSALLNGPTGNPGNPGIGAGVSYGGGLGAFNGSVGAPGAQEAIRKQTFQRLLVLFALCRGLSLMATTNATMMDLWLHGGSEELRNVLNRLALCLFFSVVSFQVLFWVDIVNPKVSIRSRRIWNSFILANAVFYVVVFGSSMVQLVMPQWIDSFQVDLWTEMVPVVLIAIGNLAFSAGLMYTTCKMRHRVGRVLKQAAAATTSHGVLAFAGNGSSSASLNVGGIGGSGGLARRRLDEQAQAKLHRALHFTIWVMTLCGVVFVLRMVLYLQRLWTRTECSPLVPNENACILVGYLLPEAVPCGLFLLLMWEVDSQKSAPKRNASTTSTFGTVANSKSPALVNEKTPLLHHDVECINSINTNDGIGTKLGENYKQLPLQVKTKLGSVASLWQTPPLNPVGPQNGSNGGSWSTPYQNRRSSPLSSGLHRDLVLQRAKSVEFEADYFNETLESVNEHTTLWMPSIETIASTVTTPTVVKTEQSSVREQAVFLQKNTAKSISAKAAETSPPREDYGTSSSSPSAVSLPAQRSSPAGSPRSRPSVWVSFQCFNLKLPSKTSRSFVVVHFMDATRNDPRMEIGRTEIVHASKHASASANELCFHRMISIDMNPCEAIKVSVYTVRNPKSIEDLTTQWLVGETIVGLKALVNQEPDNSMLPAKKGAGKYEEDGCGMAMLCELYSPLCRSSSSGVVVIRCEADWNPTCLMNNEQRITRAFIYHMTRVPETPDDEETTDLVDVDPKQGKHDMEAITALNVTKKRKRTQKLLVEEELIESVYTWEIPYQLLQLMLADLLFKLDQLKRENEQDQPPPCSDGSTATTTSMGHHEYIEDLESGIRLTDKEKAQTAQLNTDRCAASDDCSSNEEVPKLAFDSCSSDTSIAELDDALAALTTGGVTEMIYQIQGDAMVRKKRKWRSAVIVMMEEYVSLMEHAILKYGDAQLGGLTFKPSTMKADSSLCFLALNLHQQLLTVGNALPTRARDVLNNHADALRYSRLVKSFVGSICSTNSDHHRRISSENVLQDLTGPGDELDDFIEEEILEEENEEDDDKVVGEADTFGEEASLHVEPHEALRRRVVSFDSAENILSMNNDERHLSLPREQRILAETVVALGKHESTTTQASSSDVTDMMTGPSNLLVATDANDTEQGEENESPTRQFPDNLESTQPFSQHRMYGTTTVGAFAAHVYGFKNGGIRQLREEIAKVERQLEKETTRQTGFSELSVEALERQYHELKWHADRRLEIAFCQSMSALVTCFQQTLFVHLHDKTVDVPNSDADCTRHSPRSVVLRANSVLEKGLRYLDMISQIGFLFSVESLLSTYANEAGMLGDMDAAVKELGRVQIKLRPVKTPEESSFRVALTSSPVGILVELPLVLNDPAKFPDRLMHRIGGQDAFTGAVYLPMDTSEMDASQAQQLEQRLHNILRRHVQVVPVLFSQGMNEMQTVANTVGKHALQKEINEENVVVLDNYWQAFRKYHQVRLVGTTNGSFGASISSSGASPKSTIVGANLNAPSSTSWMEQLAQQQCVMDDLKSTIRNAGREKCMAILLLSSSLARSLGGGRVTCCKSAKDRTAMSITLEEANLLVVHHGLALEARDEFTCLLRTHGVRRENARKNIGTAQYCFSALQNYMLPSEYKCPPGTGGGSRSFS